MRSNIVIGLSGLSLVAASACATAQEAAPAAKGIEEVIVSARRQSEVLLDVPQAMNVINADVIDDLKILKFEDVQAAVPGLSLSSGGSGYNTSASMRGVTFDPSSRTSPTVEFYMNDALVASNFLFQSMFDVGQVEVLRGPQGTLRGRASPSGAITITTKEANVSSFGGYVGATTTNLDSNNLQGAVNVPLVQDKLGLRVSGLIDRNDFDGVKSINSSEDPESKTNAYRVNLRFEPTDSFDASLMYQHMRKDQTNFNAVTGTGNGYNGPTLSSGDRRGITDGANLVDQIFDMTVAQANWELDSILLSYVGSYARWDSDIHNPLDGGNLLLSAEPYQHQEFVNKRITHELRLASLEPVFEHFDYTVGAFYSKADVTAGSPLPFVFFPGAFGSPAGAPNPTAYDPRYVLWANPVLTTEDKEISLFANLTWHLTDATDLAVGGRYIKYKGESDIQGDTAAALMAIPPGFGPLNMVPPGTPCAALGMPSTYTGFCDVPIPRMTNAINLPAPDVTEETVVYNVTLSHHFDADLMGYATLGTSWRPGVDASAGINNGTNNSQLRDLTLVDPEKSRTYELGFKWAFMQNRGRLNAAIYHQEFDGLIFQPAAVPYLSYTSSSATPDVITQQFIANSNAVVDGFDIDAMFLITPNWSVASGASYADGRVDNDDVPCRDSNFDGQPDTGVPTAGAFPADSVVAFCKSTTTVGTAPYWNANLQSEYKFPVVAGADGYVRGLYTYFPDNSNRSKGYTVDSYGLLNVYVGLRNPEGAWDVSLFVKNALDEETTLSKDPDAIESYGGINTTFGSSGYYATSTTPRREAGLSVRYAFGSR